MRRCVFLVILASYFVACKDCPEDYACTQIQGAPNISYLNESSEDLFALDPEDGGLSVIDVREITHPKHRLVVDVEDPYSDEFGYSETIINIRNGGMYIPNKNGEFDTTDFVIEYSRREKTYVDTMRVYPLDLSTECCMTHTWNETDVEFFGRDIIRYESRVDIAGFYVTLPD